MKSEELYLFELPASCSVDDCGRPVLNRRDRLCRPHYVRSWRYGDPFAGGPMRDNRPVAQPVVDYLDGTRRCNQCEQRLPLEQFHRDAGNTAGRRSFCAECHRAKAREWYAANRERQAQREKDRRAADPEKYRRWDAERYERDREKRIALATQQTHKRRARLQAGEYDSSVTRRALRIQYGDLCFYCAVSMDFRSYPRPLVKPENLATIEHVIAISAGGGHTWDNVVLACLDCNLRKNAKPLDEWLGEAS